MPLTATILCADTSIAKSRDLLNKITEGLRESARTVARSRRQINESLVMLQRIDVSLADFVSGPSVGRDAAIAPRGRSAPADGGGNQSADALDRDVEQHDRLRLDPPFGHHPD